MPGNDVEHFRFVRERVEPPVLPFAGPVDRPRRWVAVLGNPATDGVDHQHMHIIGQRLEYRHFPDNGAVVEESIRHRCEALAGRPFAAIFAWFQHVIVQATTRVDGRTDNHVPGIAFLPEIRVAEVIHVFCVDNRADLLPRPQIRVFADRHGYAGIARRDAMEVIDTGVESECRITVVDNITRPDALLVKSELVVLEFRPQRIGQVAPGHQVITRHMSPVHLGLVRSVRRTLIEEMPGVFNADHPVRFVGPVRWRHRVKSWPMVVTGKARFGNNQRCFPVGYLLTIGSA